MHRSLRLLVPAACAGLLVGCGGSSSDSDSSSNDSQYQATITRTTHGTAHVRAEDFGSLGFGQGYAFAEDRFCTLMDQIVKVRSERARFHGPGVSNANIASDLAYHALNVQGRAETQLAQLDSDTSAMLEGYVAGFNAYLDDTGASSLPGECAGAAWVSPISEVDMMAYYLDLATLAGTRQLLPALANAQPPGRALAMSLPVDGPLTIIKDHASNGVAIGSELSASDGGVLLSNTHLPWEDELKYHEVHLTIPGEFDVAGVSLSGGLGVQIGFNSQMAWTHTTSPSNQFLIYQLTLDNEDATTYMLDGEPVAMESREVSVEVAGLDAPITRTVYQSRFGPILKAPAQGLDWDSTRAFALYDMNIDNGAFLATFLKMARAQSVRELQAVFEANGGVPWNHTMATDSAGEAFYADTTFVPNLHPAVEAAFLDAALTPENATEMLVAGAFQSGIVLLDGSTSMTLPVAESGVRVAGSVPFRNAPQTIRNDYVMNSNDSFWLPNPAETLTAPSRLYGDAGEQARSFRTRMGLTQLEELLPDQVTGKSLQELLFANRSFTAELWRNDICVGDLTNVTDSDSNIVDITGACTVIENTWDGTLNLDSQGVATFREALSGIKAAISSGDIADYFSTPFNPEDPLNTPAGLSATGQTQLKQGLADAMQRLESLGIALDAPLRDLQFTRKGDTVIPVHGGLQQIDGAYNKVEYRDNAAMFTSTLSQMERAPVVNKPTNLTEEGYLINYGASYVLTVTFGAEGPEADALLTYSQSNHSASPFFKDQTELYSNESWRPVPFTSDDITAAAVSEKTVNR